jgi:hypothetical protein
MDPRPRDVIGAAVLVLVLVSMIVVLVVAAMV